MTKKDSWKFLLCLLSFSFFYSCGTSKIIQQENWTHFFDPCTSGETTSISGELYLIEQEQRNDCWFACYAMLKAWKDQKDYSYQEVKSKLGKWKNVISRNLGLFVSEQPQFINEMNLGFYPPANYVYEGFVEKLSDHGPLMICMSKSGFNHARILYKIECGPSKSKTFFHLINPKGAKYEKWNAYEFFDTFESEAGKIVTEHENLSEEEKETNDKMNKAWRYQIIYIK